MLKWYIQNMSGNEKQLSITRLELDMFRLALCFVSGKCGSGYFYVPFTFIIVLYVLLIIEAYHCQLRKDLRGKTNCKKAYDLIDRYKRAYPIIWWRVICYHYAKRSRQTTSYRNGDAYITTQDYYERVIFIAFYGTDS